MLLNPITAHSCSKRTLISNTPLFLQPLRELMVMTFLDGAPLTEAGKLVGNLSRAKKDMAKRLILKRWVRGARRAGQGHAVCKALTQ